MWSNYKNFNLKKFYFYKIYIKIITTSASKNYFGVNDLIVEPFQIISMLLIAAKYIKKNQFIF